MSNITARKATVYYTGTGAVKKFIFTFDFMNSEYIKVTVNGVAMIRNSDFTLDIYSVPCVDFNVAPAEGSVIKIYRVTPSDRLVAWSDDSRLSSMQLNSLTIQLLHLAEENHDLMLDQQFTLDPVDDCWDGGDKRIKDVADPINNQDVVTKHYMHSVGNGFVATVMALCQRAETAALTAEGHAATALGYKQAAELAKTAAQTAQQQTQAALATAMAGYAPLAARVSDTENDIADLNSDLSSAVSTLQGNINAKMDNDRITVDFDTPVDEEGANGDLWFVAAVPEA